MNNYSRRSEYYKYEFNSTQDFPLLSDVIRKIRELSSKFLVEVVGLFLFIQHTTVEY